MLPWLIHLFRRSRQRTTMPRRRERDDARERHENEDEEHLRRVRLRAARRHSVRDDRAGKKA